MNYKLGEILGKVIKNDNNGLVDVNYNGTIVTLPLSDNELPIQKMETGGKMGYDTIYEVRYTDSKTKEEVTDLRTTDKDKALDHLTSLRQLGYKQPHIQYSFKKGGILMAETGIKTGGFNIGYRPEFMNGNVLLGRKIEIKLPNGEVRKGQFAIVELADVLASHNEQTYQTTENYPTDTNGENVNDRNYKDDVNAQQKVVEFARDLQPDRLITTSRTASGTPVITTDGVVISGNNRTMSIKLAELDYPEKYREYCEFLIEEISSYGFKGIFDKTYGVGKPYLFTIVNDYNDGKSKSFKNPLLVRIDYDVPEYSTMELAKWNKDTKKSERPIDKAIKLGKILASSDRCELVIADIVGKYETFTDFYSNLADQKALKDQLISCNILTTQELPAYFFERGFTEQGKELIENLLAGMVLSKEALIASNEGGARTYRQTIITSLPVLTANLGLGDEYSLLPVLNEALMFQTQMTNSKISFEDILNQQNIFGEKPSREAVIMNRLLASGRNKFKGAMEGYNASVTDNQNASLFGEKPTKDEIFETYITNKIDANDRKAISMSYGSIKEEETPFIAPSPIENKISSQKGLDNIVDTFTNINKETLSKNMERTITTSNPFVNGNFFKEHPEKVLADKIEETSSRWGKNVTAYRGGIENVSKIDADENFINSDEGSNPQISVTQEPVTKATEVNTQVTDNLINAIQQSNKDVAKKSIRKTKKEAGKMSIEPTATEGEIVPVAENFAKLSANIPMDDVEAFLVYQKMRGRPVTNNSWIEMTGLSAKDLYSEENITRLVKAGALNYYNGDLLPSYLYFAENVYEKKSRLISESANSGQDKDHIIETYGESTYEVQVHRLQDVFKKQYEKRLLVTGEGNNEGLALVPNSKFAKEFIINTLVDELPFRWKKVTAQSNKRYGQMDLLVPYLNDRDKDDFPELNLKNAFAYWLRTDETIGYHKGMNYADIINYYLFAKGMPKGQAQTNSEGKYVGEQLILHKKEVAEFERLKSKSKEEGVRLFKIFLDKFLTTKDKIRLESLWNNEFNGYVPIDYNNVPVAFRSNRYFDGFPGDIENEKREAVAFVISEGSGLLAYDVGVGKTPSAIFTISQYIDLGWCKRPMVIVPNQTYKQWIAEFKKFCGHIPINEFYNFNKDYLENYQNAKGELERVAEGSVSIFTYEGMEALGFNENTIETMKPNLMEILLQTDPSEVEKSNKQKDRDFEKLNSQVEKLIGKALTKTAVSIEDLGFDFICIDEAHACKKVFTGVKGEAETSSAVGGDSKGEKGRANSEYQISSGTPSSRGIKGFMLTHYIQTTFGGNTLLLTATPFTNSPLEIYSMLSMVAYEKLVSSNINNLKAFFDTYVNVSYELIINSKLHPERKQVILGFNNLLSLQTLIRRFINYKSGDDIESVRKKRPNKIVLPMRQKMIDGVVTSLGVDERKDTILPLTPLQAEMMDKIQQYANGEISEGAMCSGPTIDNPEEHDDQTEGVELDEDSLDQNEKIGVRTLKALAHARNLALSPYIFECSGLGKPTYEEYINTSNKLKYVMECIRSIKKYHAEHNEAMSGVVIYLDRGKEFMPLIKEYLVKEIGFMEHEVGIMSSGIMEPVNKSSKRGEDKKEGAKEYIKNLFLGLKYNDQTMEMETLPDDQRLKVLIGSSMIREGINLQAHSSTLFNCWLDWNPSDQKQLYGRIFRQGNKFNTIRLVVPLMIDSIDIFIFEKLGQKTSRINSIWETDGHTNEFNTAEFNPSDLKRVLIKSPYVVAELEMIEVVEKFDEDMADIDNKIKRLNKVKEYDTTIKRWEDDLAEWLEEYRPSNDKKRSVENMVGLALEVIRSQKDSKGKPMVHRWQQTKHYEEIITTDKDGKKHKTQGPEIRDYYSDLDPASKQYWMNDLFVAVRNLKRETRDFLEPSGVKISTIPAFIEKLEKEKEEKSKAKEKLTSKESITTRANEIMEERERNKFKLRELPEVVEDFTSLNYVLSDVKVPKAKPVQETITSCPPVDEKGNVKVDKEALEQLDKCNKEATQTKRLHTSEGENGERVYTESRLKLHDKIIEDFKGNAVCTDQIQPIAVLTGGAPGSGKSTFLKKFAPYLQSDKIIHVDADEIRAELPEYQGWNAFQTHEETRDILSKLLDSYDKPCKHDLIYDGTMANAKKYRPIIAKLHQLGYKVFVVYMDVPMAVSKQRALARYQDNKTGSKFGRYVPMEVIDEFFETGKAGFEEIKNDVEGYILVDSLTQQIVEKGGEDIPTNRDYSIMFQPSKVENNVFETQTNEPTKADLEASLKGAKTTIKYLEGEEKKTFMQYIKGLEVTIKYL